MTKTSKEERIMEPVKHGFIRYYVPELTELVNGSGVYPVTNCYIDLPEDHSFWVLIGTSIFEV